MTTLAVCLLIILVFLITVKKLKNFFTQKKQESLDREVSNDLEEEFTSDTNRNDFLDWVEEIQLETQLASKKSKNYD